MTVWREHFLLGTLGVPLGTAYLGAGAVHYQVLLEALEARINSWTSKGLSYAGGIQLIKYVLAGTGLKSWVFQQAFWKRWRYFAGSSSGQVTHRNHTKLVAWHIVCLPKKVGGLGILVVKQWNEAAIGKWLWKMVQHKEELCTKWVHGVYIKGMSISWFRKNLTNPGRLEVS